MCDKRPPWQSILHHCPLPPLLPLVVRYTAWMVRHVEGSRGLRTGRRERELMQSGIKPRDVHCGNSVCLSFLSSWVQSVLFVTAAATECGFFGAEVISVFSRETSPLSAEKERFGTSGGNRREHSHLSITRIVPLLMPKCRQGPSSTG